MEDNRIVCRKGKCVDLDYVDCESEFDSRDDVRYCEYMKEEYSDWLDSPAK
ncbi:hypothetical protein JW711_05535 [Candidatus Woesearchaeota archaeon]|nr:hypothetical protein [Candidatus Woesearchaeota archaeon]